MPFSPGLMGLNKQLEWFVYGVKKVYHLLKSHRLRDFDGPLGRRTHMGETTYHEIPSHQSWLEKPAKLIQYFNAFPINEIPPFGMGFLYHPLLQV